MLAALEQANNLNAEILQRGLARYVGMSFHSLRAASRVISELDVMMLRYNMANIRAERHIVPLLTGTKSAIQVWSSLILPTKESSNSICLLLAILPACVFPRSPTVSFRTFAALGRSCPHRSYQSPADRSGSCCAGKGSGARMRWHSIVNTGRSLHHTIWLKTPGSHHYRCSISKTSQHKAVRVESGAYSSSKGINNARDCVGTSANLSVSGR